MFVCKHLYPEDYKFGEEERFVFNLGVAVGELCPIDLTEVNFRFHVTHDLDYIRMDLEVNEELLKHCYAIEKACFPFSKESQRL